MRLQFDEQFAPALRAFPNTDLKANQLFPAFRRRTDDDQHAGGIVLHAGLEIDPIGPDVDVVSRRQVAVLPAIIVGLPIFFQPPDHRGRQVRCFLADERGKSILEVASGDAAQIDSGEQRIKAIRPTRPFRQYRRSEGDPWRTIQAMTEREAAALWCHITSADAEHQRRWSPARLGHGTGACRARNTTETAPVDRAQA